MVAAPAAAPAPAAALAARRDPVLRLDASDAVSVPLSSVDGTDVGPRVFLFAGDGDATAFDVFDAFDAFDNGPGEPVEGVE